MGQSGFDDWGFSSLRAVAVAALSVELGLLRGGASTPVVALLAAAIVGRALGRGAA